MPATKAALRRAALAQRLALPPAEAARRCDELREQLFQQFTVSQWRWLHVFLPIVARNEPDTWGIIRRIWEEQLPVRLAAPVVQAGGSSLRHYELRADTPLAKNRWGIAEPAPVAAAEVAPAALDAVLVPLLACDRHGQRVGYGGGFYDRFLAQCQPGTAFIGLSLLDEVVDEIADVEATDVALTALLTPGGVRRW